MNRHKFIHGYCSFLYVLKLEMRRSKEIAKTGITSFWEQGTKQVILNTFDRYFKPPFFLKISIFDTLNASRVQHWKNTPFYAFFWSRMCTLLCLTGLPPLRDPSCIIRTNDLSMLYWQVTVTGWKWRHCQVVLEFYGSPCRKLLKGCVGGPLLGWLWRHFHSHGHLSIQHRQVIRPDDAAGISCDTSPLERIKKVLKRLL